MEGLLAKPESSLAAADGMLLRISCPRCDLELPLRLSCDGERTALWVCDDCQTYIAGMLVPELAVDLAHRVRLGERHFDTCHSRPIPPSFGETVSRWIRNHRSDHPGSEQRSDGRTEVRLKAAVAGLDSNWAPEGLPVQALVVNLSRNGLGMVTRSTIDTPLVAVQMRGQTGTVQLLAEIVWTNCVGCSFCHIGTRFVHRLGKSE